LDQAGFDVLVAEQADHFAEVGAGVALGPNATRILRRMGLGTALAKVAVRPARIQNRRWEDGRVLTDGKSAGMAEQRFGAPFYNLYRPDLIEVLADHIRPDLVRLGSRCTDVVTGKNGQVSVVLDDGTVETADVVVGADGTHSGVRAATVGDAPARFSGVAVYRTVVPRERLGSREHLGSREPMLIDWLGPGRVLVAYWVGRDARYLNLLCGVPEPEWTTESWQALGSAADLRTHFAGWSSEVTELLAQVTDPVYRWALYDREPLAHWSTAATTLLGDACHPMLPFMGQGAAQAIEDAATLTRCLTDGDENIPPALARYEALRLPRTAQVQRMSWDNGIRCRLPDGPPQRARDEQLEQISRSQFAWLYSHDAGQI
jgi:salicylate hydroxylase